MKPPFAEIETRITERMLQKQMAPAVIREYLRRTKLVYDGASGKTDWDAIGDLAPDDMADLESLPAVDAAAEQADLAKLVVIKLNGGLGTTMGLTRAKSLMRVKGADNFLQIIRKQIVALRARRGVNLPVLFMNSFVTREDTLAEPGLAELNRGAPGEIPIDFLQNMAPRIDRTTLLPVGDGADESHWCPPGHGDVFLSLLITGILDRLIANGYRTAFLSNGDNLGATVDERALHYFHSENLEFMSEVTPKTAVDLKGGVLFRRRMSGGAAGPIELLETAQVPDEHLPDFQDVRRFAHFNINNLWVNLPALKDRLERGALELALIVNPKKLGEQDILQLETAMGAAIGQFDRTRVLIVPRRRFAPVKDCADLLVRRSDCYVLREDAWSLERNPARTLAGEPVISLDPAYKKVADFERLVPVAPSLLDCEALSVEGAVLFDAPVTIRGRVKLKALGVDAKISSIKKTVLDNESVEL